ncbi:chemotaxis protein CheA [Pleionea sediminis]|uniref:chemotaxis protein CheA n=1 Tax=Pleionea sediminis TaxID=2569479 RepID=UPI001185B855|nr:chemotaxis protein CheA [Pleionea sediminis]
MSIDISQFHQVFFEESMEGLDVMEQSLLELDPESVDSESINTIFRAAHSIKGGSATFKFDEVASFTHILETLLDEMRNGDRPVTAQAVDLLLKSVDCLRSMFNLLQNEEPIDDNLYQDIAKQLQAMTEQSGNDVQIQSDNSEQSTIDSSSSELSRDSELNCWSIKFVPEPQILRTGNEPIRMFRELETLGELSVKAKVEKVPGILELEEDACFLSWDLMLQTESSKEIIEEIFEWVLDECTLSIEQISQSVSSSKDEAPTPTIQQMTKPSLDKFEDSRPFKDDESIAVKSDTAQIKSTSTTIVKTEDGQNDKPGKPVNSAASSIRVSINKVDNLINQVGELVITQSMLGQMGETFNESMIDRLKEGLSQLEQNTRELQESVMQIRMLPISFVFSRFPRMMRDLSGRLNKKIELVIKGESTELDKTVMEQIGDPLVHLVRNSADHGIEMPEKRVAVGKPEFGTVTLDAYHEGGNIVIRIEDDGAGINTERIREKALQRGIIHQDAELSKDQINHLIFEPGFSTADVISDVSGRGVGMDVVKKNIISLGGTVDIESEYGVGSSFIIRLPLTLAILDGQLVRVGDQIYIVPLTSIIESMQLKTKDLVSVAGNMEVFKLRDEHIPLVRLYESFNIKADSQNDQTSTVVVVEGGGTKIGLMVDELLSQQQVVIKSLESNFVAIEGISGATILGDGKVALILDVSGMVSRSTRAKSKRGVKAA